MERAGLGDARSMRVEQNVLQRPVLGMTSMASEVAMVVVRVLKHVIWCKTVAHIRVPDRHASLHAQVIQRAPMGTGVRRVTVSVPIRLFKVKHVVAMGVHATPVPAWMVSAVRTLAVERVRRVSVLKPDKAMACARRLLPAAIRTTSVHAMTSLHVGRPASVMVLGRVQFILLQQRA